MSTIQWDDDCKNAMVSLFCIGAEHGFEVDTDTIESLKHHVMQLVRMASQKNAGQRGNARNIPWDNLPRVQGAILCEATALVLSGYLGELPKTIDNERDA